MSLRSNSPVMIAAIGFPSLPFPSCSFRVTRISADVKGRNSDFVAQQSWPRTLRQGSIAPSPGMGTSTPGVDRSIPGDGHHRPLASIAPSLGMGTIDPWRRSLHPWGWAPSTPPGHGHHRPSGVDRPIPGDGHHRPLASIAPSLVMDTIDPLASIAPSLVMDTTDPSTRGYS